MNRYILIGAVMAALTIGTSSVRTAGDLFLYNWTDYTAPDLVEKFESETGIKVTLDTYDSNETLLAKLKQGGGGYDIVVPSHNFVEILIKENLIQRINAKSLPGYDNIDAKWQGPAWDPGNEYTVPWQWGTTSFTVDSAVYAGTISTRTRLCSNRRRSCRATSECSGRRMKSFQWRKSTSGFRYATKARMT